MWLLEQCLKEWKKEGISYAYEKLVKMAESAPAFRSLIDPDHVSFANPVSMTKAISEYCTATGQAAPIKSCRICPLYFRKPFAQV